ncbi:MAG: hypothetical protein RL042_2108 [Nitrospirota bacterium]|jgi:hypothetical protein
MPPQTVLSPVGETVRQKKQVNATASRRVRLTVSLPSDLVDRLRDAVYWSPNLKLAWLIAQSLRTSLADLETSRQSPFPKRMMALRAGRPRLVGQAMTVQPRARLNENATAIPAEKLAETALGSQPSIP